MSSIENNKKFDIKIGDYEVYDAGSVTSIQGEPIEFDFKTFKIKIVFESQSDVKPSIVTEPNLAEQKLVIKLINFDNNLGTETTLPLNVATLNGKALLLHFRVYAMDPNNSNRLFNYTWLLKTNNVSDGGNQ